MAAAGGEASRRWVFVRNLPFAATNADLEAWAGDAGPIKHCFVVTDKETQRSRGFGYVQFAIKEDAATAVTSLDKSRLKGRVVSVQAAQSRPPTEKRTSKGKKGSKRARDAASPTPEAAAPEPQAATPESDSDAAADSGSDTSSGDEEEAVESSAADSDGEEAESGSNDDASSSGDGGDSSGSEGDSDESSAEEEEEEEPTPVVTKQPAAAQPPPAQRVRQAPSTSSGAKGKAEAIPLSQTSKLERGRQVLVTGLAEGTTRQHVYKRFRKLGAVERVQMPADPEQPEDHSALVVYTSQRDAHVAAHKIHEHVFKGAKISARVYRRPKGVFATTDDKGPQTKFRLIVRNLHFSCHEGILRKHFKSCGTIVEAHVVVDRATKKSRGFGFVQFEHEAEASKAIAKLNASSMLGRTVAVDWAVSKTNFERAKQQAALAELMGKPQAEGEEQGEAGSGSEGDGDEEAEAEDSGADSGGSSDGSDDGESDQDDTDEDESDGSGGESDDAAAEAEEATKRAQRPKREYNDVGEGRTVFIRNLPFDLEDEDVEEEFEQFGEIKLCMVVRNKETGMSRGKAFVKFGSAASAQACIQAAQDKDEPLVLEGRPVTVHLAVDRSQAEELRTAGVKAKEDKRRLYLLREGQITPGVEAYEALSAQDKALRDALREDSKTKIKSPNFVVSDTRLSLHNIPLSVDEKELKTICRTAIGNKHAPVQQCIVVRHKEKVGDDGKPRSKGFGFIEFKTHEHALQALRGVNNNPSVFPKGRRAVVMFAWENALVLKQKADRIKRFKTKQQARAAAGSHPPASQGPNAGQQGRKRRRTDGGAAGAAKPAKAEHKAIATLRFAGGNKASRPANGPASKQSRGKKGGGDRKGAAPAPTASARQQRQAPKKRPAARAAATPTEKPNKRRRQHKEQAAEASFDQLLTKYKKRLAVVAGAEKTLKWYQ